MALPSGYKRLEYIQSTGTQYINTGFKPNNNTRVLMTGYNVQAGPLGLFGSRDADYVSMYGCWTLSSTQVRAEFNAALSDITVDTTGALEVELNKNIFTINGISIQLSTSTFQGNYPMYLFTQNMGGSPDSRMYIGKLFSFRLFDNGTLVRDFIPCQTSSGEVGLWDDVNGEFYGNAGTGTFTAGPVVAAIPDPPSNLHQSMSVRLAWASVSDAERYNIYRDGTLIASTTDLFYVDDTAAENTEYIYGVSAVNSAGESPKTTIPIYTKSGYFLYKPYVESATFQ